MRYQNANSKYWIPEWRHAKRFHLDLHSSQTCWERVMRKEDGTLTPSFFSFVLHQTCLLVGILLEHTAAAHYYMCVCVRVYMWVCGGVGGGEEIKEWREGQMERLSEGCTSVLVNSRVCFHEGPLSSWHEPYVLEQNIWCVCVFWDGDVQLPLLEKFFLTLDLYGAVQGKPFSTSAAGRWDVGSTEKGKTGPITTLQSNI